MRRKVEFPFQPLDKAFLAGTQAPWASFAPVWRLEYQGEVSEEQLVRALGFVLERYRWAAARVVREAAWVLPETIDARRQFFRLDAPTPDAEAALADRFLALDQQAPLTLTWVRRTDSEGALVFQQHHSLADGRAFLALVTDFLKCLDAPASPLPAGLVPRRAEHEALAERSVFTFLRGAVHTLKELLLGNLWPLTPLRSNEGTDYTGKNRTRHLFVPAARLDAWKERRTQRGLSTNDLLAGALCAALTRWTGKPGRHNLLMMIDVRPREGFESFANHLSTVQVRWRGSPESRALDLAQALKAAAAPVLAARLPWKRILFDGFVMLRTPMAVLRHALLVKRQLLTNHSFSNLLALGPRAPWRTSRLVVQRLLITTPCTPPQAANTTVVRYGDTVCFNFNFKDSALPAAEVERLVDEFGRALDEIDRELSR